MQIKIISIGLGLLITNTLFAQKKPIDHSVYDQWKSIQSPNVSKSGKFISYQIEPQEGDGLLQLKGVDNSLIISAPRAKGGKLTKSESHLIATIKPFFEESRQAKIKKKKADAMPKDTLLIVDIASRAEEKIPGVKSHKLALYKNDFLAYVYDQKIEADTTKGAKSSKGKDITTLVLRNLKTGDTTQFPKADTYSFSPDESYLVFSRKKEAKDSTAVEAGLFMYDIANKNLKKISSTGVFKGLEFDDTSKQFAFLSDKSPEKSLTKDFKLYYYTSSLDTARLIADQHTAGVPQNWYVSGDASLNFSSDSKKLYLGLAPIPKVKDTTLVDFEHANVDIWHWQEDYLQTQQLANLKRDQSKSYLAVVYPQDGNRLVALVDDTFNRVSTTDDATGEWVLASTDFGNRVEAQWEGMTSSDVYIVSTINGDKRLVKKGLRGQSMLSPDGKFVLYFDVTNANWYSYAIQGGTTVVLNDGIPVGFANEENDMPIAASSYGVAGWAASGKGVFIYDRYDIWYFDLMGKQKRLVTNGEGRATRTSYRYLRLDRSENPRYRTSLIADKQNMYLTAFNEQTKYNGVYTANAGKQQRPSELFMAPYTFRAINSDDAGKVIAYTKEDYQASPDLYVTKSFKNEERLTDINPQQVNYNWGTAELVKWTTPAGHEAEGILYKPENFDPNKKYPIIAYFYERLSDGLYTYQAPAPTPSRLNIPYFVSNEYLVFAPDIRYEDGYPGKAAEEYINSGMRYLAQNAWVDSTKMGIQGQSWGGYQVAHLITRTNMYAAAWTGAPVVNMTSAYGGIRWTSGMNRQFQYERTQSRLGKTLWDAHDLYVENSPLFFMDRVNTPVAIMHNDQDGAVPWYQGIEMFTALRRLQKPVWLLNYNGDDHNLIKRQNRKDIQIRQGQFFDHFLKGKEAPKWIKSGVPAVEKGIDWGFSFQ